MIKSRAYEAVEGEYQNLNVEYRTWSQKSLITLESLSGLESSGKIAINLADRAKTMLLDRRRKTCNDGEADVGDPVKRGPRPKLEFKF